MFKYLLPAVLFASAFIADISAELAVPANYGDKRVVDKAGVLSSSDINRLDAVIERMEKASKGQMAVLIIPSLKGDSLEDFSMRVAEKWKIGHKGADNGLLLLISKNDRKIRLEVGYGWEGKINDARAGDIIRGMGPFFRSGRYADGISYAIGKAQEFITGKAPDDIPRQTVRNENKDSLAKTIFAILIVIIIILSFIFRGRNFYFCGICFSGGGFSGGGGGFSSGGGSFGGGSFGGGGASGGW